MADESREAALPFPVPNASDTRKKSPASPLVDEVVSLFDQLRDRLLRYVISFGLTAHDGEDIVQEVFLALFRHLQQGKSRSNLRAWTFRVAHNLSLKRRAQARIGTQQTIDDPAGLADLVPDTSPNPEDQMVHSQRRERILAVMAALAEQDRHCLTLRAEGLRYREIAEVLDISLGAVSLSLERSLARLARAAQW